MDSQIWKIAGQTLKFDGPLLMGIINITPDSFSDGNLYLEPIQALKHAEKLIQDGAHILDLGAESTRPGAKAISAETEWIRLRPVLTELMQWSPLPISIDTRHAEVARRALEVGAKIINDVSGAQDPALLRVVAEFQAGYVLMHMRGKLEDKEQNAAYHHTVEEVMQELHEGLERVKAANIIEEFVCVDPGFGFAKDIPQNHELFQNLSRFLDFSRPLLVGVSRKRMLRQLVGEALELLPMANAIAALLALQQGACIFRVHEVKETKLAFEIFHQLSKNHRLNT